LGNKNGDLGDGEGEGGEGDENEDGARERVGTELSGDEVGERADVQMKKSKLASKLIRVPLEFIETVQETFDAPSFGNKQSHETWMACVEALHNSADDERVNELTAEVRELRLQLEKLSLRSVAATLE
jgi:paraquat-inducible protein B